MNSYNCNEFYDDNSPSPPQTTGTVLLLPELKLSTLDCKPQPVTASETINPSFYDTIDSVSCILENSLIGNLNNPLTPILKESPPPYSTTGSMMASSLKTEESERHID